MIDSPKSLKLSLFFGLSFKSRIVKSFWWLSVYDSESDDRTLSTTLLSSTIAGSHFLSFNHFLGTPTSFMLSGLALMTMLLFFLTFLFGSSGSGSWLSDYRVRKVLFLSPSFGFIQITQLPMEQQYKYIFHISNCLFTFDAIIRNDHVYKSIGEFLTALEPLLLTFRPF